MFDLNISYTEETERQLSKARDLIRQAKYRNEKDPNKGRCIICESFFWKIEMKRTTIQRQNYLMCRKCYGKYTSMPYGKRGDILSKKIKDRI